MSFKLPDPHTLVRDFLSRPLADVLKSLEAIEERLEETDPVEHLLYDPFMGMLEGPVERILQMNDGSEDYSAFPSNALWTCFPKTSIPDEPNWLGGTSTNWGALSLTNDSHTPGDGSENAA